MKDKLEGFIKEHKDQFDVHEPKPELWNRIESKLEIEKPTTDYNWIWKVAAMLFLASTLALLFYNPNSVENLDSTPVALNEGYSDELIEVEEYYTQLIAEKRQLIVASDVQNEELLAEIDVLDSMYIELKNNLKTNQEDERLMNAMIRNLQIRVEILNKQLNILEHIQKATQDENISI